MKVFRRFFLWILLLPVLVGCASQATEPEATVAEPTIELPMPESLPTAVQPKSVGSNWAISYQHSMPTGFWSEGVHTYGFLMTCPFLGQIETGTEWQQLKVSDSAPLLPDPVYLRLSGQNTGPMNDIIVDAINPAQETIAVITIVGVSEDNANKAFNSPDCQVVMRWDSKGTEILEPLPPFQP